MYSVYGAEHDGTVNYLYRGGLAFVDRQLLEKELIRRIGKVGWLGREGRSAEVSCETLASTPPPTSILLQIDYEVS